MPDAERTGRNVITLRHGDVRAGWSQRYLLIADVHLDNPHCERNLLRRHLDEAKNTGAGVLCIGDMLDVMGGRSDPRRSKSGVKANLNDDAYLDRVIDDAATFLGPYRDNLVMLADGNHETAIRRNLETDMLARLARELGTQHMGYSGWVRFLFEAEAGGGRSQRRLYYHHGAGGGGEVTRGVIGTNRRAVYLPDADVVATGHIHEAWQVEIVRHRLTMAGRERRDCQLHIQLPTYKDEFELSGGYHIEKGRPPKPLGGWWLVFDHTTDAQGKIRLTTQRAA